MASLATEFGNEQGIDPPIKMGYCPLPGEYIVPYIRGNYLKNKTPLTRLAEEFARNEIGWSESLAHATLSKGMDIREDAKEDEVPSALLFVRKGEGVIGVSIARKLVIHTEADGDVDFLYYILRAFREEYRAGGRGTFASQQHRLIHPETNWGGHCTPNPAAAYSFYRSGIFIAGRRFPWDARFNTDILAQDIMYGLFRKVRINPDQSIDPVTGVIKGGYPEPHRGYKVRPHSETLEFRRIMREELGMRFGRKDESVDRLCVVGELA